MKAAGVHVRSASGRAPPILVGANRSGAFTCFQPLGGLHRICCCLPRYATLRLVCFWSSG